MSGIYYINDKKVTKPGALSPFHTLRPLAYPFGPRSRGKGCPTYPPARPPAQLLRPPAPRPRTPAAHRMPPPFTPTDDIHRHCSQSPRDEKKHEIVKAESRGQERAGKEGPRLLAHAICGPRGACDIPLLCGTLPEARGRGRFLAAWFEVLFRFSVYRQRIWQIRLETD